METHVSWITQFVNQYLGSLRAVAAHALHIHPANPDTPIPERVVMMLVVFVIGGALHALASSATVRG